MKTTLVLGDLLALALTTVIGFAAHREADLSFFPRFLAVFVPLGAAWFIFAYAFKLFLFEIVSNPRQLWRAPLAMVFAASLAVIARSFILQTEIIPVFMLALGGTSALGMMIWRGIFILLNRFRT